MRFWVLHFWVLATITILSVGCSGSVPVVADLDPELGIIESERFHEIKARETLYGIARHYKTTLHVLLDLNPGIDPAALRIGDRIRIPAGKAPVRAIEPAEASYRPDQR